MQRQGKYKLFAHNDEYNEKIAWLAPETKRLFRFIFTFLPIFLTICNVITWLIDNLTYCQLFQILWFFHFFKSNLSLITSNFTMSQLHFHRDSKHKLMTWNVLILLQLYCCWVAIQAFSKRIQTFGITNVRLIYKLIKRNLYWCLFTNDPVKNVIWKRKNKSLGFLVKFGLSTDKTVFWFT